MDKRRFGLGVVSTLMLAAAASLAQAAEPSSGSTLLQLPENYTVLVHRHDGESVTTTPFYGNPLAQGEKEIYRNNRGTFVYRPGAGLNQPGIPVADDVSTSALENCNMTRYRIAVNGGVEGGGGTFNAAVFLTNGCPASGPGGGGTTIPGTFALNFLNLNNDASIVHILEFTPANPVSIPKDVYVRAAFSTAQAGWLVGTPADIGFTANRFYASTVNSCNVGLGSGIFAGFWAQIFADDQCPASFLAYEASDFSSGPLLTDEAGNRWADDLNLALPPGQTCELASYTISFQTTSSSLSDFSVSVDLRPFNQGPIPGTATSRIVEVSGSGQRRDVFFVAEPGVFLPNPVYISWEIDDGGVGPIVVPRTRAGSSAITFHSIDSNGGWSPALIFNNDIPGIMQVRLTCRGEPPLGACCPVQDADPEPLSCVPDPQCPGQACQGTCPAGRLCELVSCFSNADCPFGTCQSGTCTERACSEYTCIDDIPVFGCAEENGRWLPASTCAENEFNPPCGTHACCKPTQSCEDLTWAECAQITDPASPTINCTIDSDCPEGRACQPNNVCEPRTAVWNSGDFCNDPQFDCAWFECYYGSGDCFESNPEIICASFEDRPCTQIACATNAECPSGSCDTSVNCLNRGGCCRTAECNGKTCLANNLCLTPLPDNALCPGETICLANELICEQPRGCGNLTCCDQVCRADDFCCLAAWDSSCVAKATQLCDFPAGNDICYCKKCSETGFLCDVADDCPRLDETCDISTDCGAIELTLVSGSGNVTADNSKASTASDDPTLCCSKVGTDYRGTGTIWYYFDMPFGLGNSARVHTCATPLGSGTDSVIQVFRATETGNLELACNSLETVGCNDDGGCGPGGLNSDLCLKNMIEGERYFVQVSSNSAETQKAYRLDVQVPCNTVLPANDDCENATSMAQSSNTSASFNLNNATIDCPNEPCAPAMLNDVWFDYTTTCVGNLVVETCAVPPAQNPATTLAVYSVQSALDACPPDALLNCNDDAEPRLEDSTCSVDGQPCAGLADCTAKYCTGTQDACTTVADCNRCVATDTPCETNDDCGVCVLNPSEWCKTSADCPQGDFCNTADNCTVSGNTCDAQTCESPCGSASRVIVPTFSNRAVRIRVGGESGGEPSGTVKVQCIPDDCQPNGIPDVLDIQLNGDCNGNGIPDDCDGGCGGSDCTAIVSSNPPNCEIDAGQPHPVDNAAAIQGWTSVELTFNPECAGVTAGDFTVSLAPGGGPAVPTISGVSGAGNVVTVNFAAPIPTNQWTCLTHTDSGEEVCLGYLPGDVNASRGTNVQDITALIDSLNNVVVRPLFATDCNRSGAANVQDITAVIDLLNGAEAFNPWNAQQITVTCPSAP